jgi:hypothetical protein
LFLIGRFLKQLFLLKQKRKLFQDSEQEQLIDEMVELIPTVMKKLQKEKLVVDFCQLLRLINFRLEM